MSLSQTLLPMPFKRPDKKVKSRMLSLPHKLRAAAMELLERVRLGLDIPSRAEVLDLAERIEAISKQLNQLEAGRVRDSKLVEELRQNALKASAKPEKKVRSPRKRAAAKDHEPAASAADQRPASPSGDKPKAKTKPRSRKRASTTDEK